VLGELTLIVLGFRQQAVFTTVFLVQLFHKATDGITFGFQLVNRITLGGEVTGNNKLGLSQFFYSAYSSSLFL